MSSVGNTFTSMSMSTPKTCVLNIVPPVFAGIATLVAQPNGGLLATWLPATDANGDTPIEYEVFVKKGTATGIYSEKPLLTYENMMLIMALADGSVLENATYFVAVRAKDSEQNKETNLVTLSALSKGVLEEDLIAAIQAMKAVAQISCGDLVGVSEDDELIGISECEV